MEELRISNAQVKEFAASCMDAILSEIKASIAPCDSNDTQDKADSKYSYAA